MAEGHGVSAQGMSTTWRASAAGPKSWRHQACADLDLAGVSAAAGHHEWACFACHQAVEKALKALLHARSTVDAIRAALA